MTSWSLRGASGTSRNTSEIVCPVIDSASPCSTPCASRIFMTWGTPPARWRSTVTNFPDGFRSHSTGTRARIVSKSSSVSRTPAAWAIARRCSTALVEPPMAIGGSTNAVLRLLAIAHAAGVRLTLDDFETMRARVPVLCDLKPSGKFVTVDLHRAGGVPQVMKILLAHGVLHGDALSITGQTITEVLRDVPEAPRKDQEVIRPWDRPLYPHGHLAILRGNLAREGGVAKRSEERRVGKEC